jgi:RNA polymerase sigma factor for flagellar operon FliA
MNSTTTATDETRTTAERNALVRKNLGLVYHVARKLMTTLHEDVELDELVSAGTIGLIEAVEKFDPELGHAFSTFAAPRIRGAILDELRRLDPVPRSVRTKERRLARAREALAERLGRQPTAEELARELDVELETLWDWEDAVTGVRPLSLSQPVSEDEGESATPQELLPDEDAEDVEDRLGHEEEIRILKEELAGLKEQQRIVLSLYYFEELKLREIGEVLGVTESRVSQIRSAALDTLRGRLSDLRSA